MLGNDFYRTDVNAELSQDRLRSLVFFYEPLIGKDALHLYQYLVLKGSMGYFEQLNELLSSLNVSVDAFEAACGKLNAYGLLKTLKKEDHYILVLNEALRPREWIRDDILVREFILKTSGPYYQKLIAGIQTESDHSGFENVSDSLDPDHLNSWSSADETYLKREKGDASYDFGTLFDVRVFLKDISTTLFPLRFRTPENLREIARLADLYHISYDRMRTYLPRVVRIDKDSFDLNELRKLCMSARAEYQKVTGDSYDVSPLLYLMNLQDGKEVTHSDKWILYNLANEYHLSDPVINVLLAHALKNCDNRLIDKYIYPIASDLHRNDVRTSKEALARLSRSRDRQKEEEKLPVYDGSGNKRISDAEEEELLKLMGKK